MSDEQPARKEVSYEEIAAEKAQRYKRMMRNSFITAIGFAVLTGSSKIYFLAHFSLPTYAFVLSSVFGLILVSVSLVSLFDAGRFSEIKDYEPRAWIKEGEYRKLRKVFDENLVRSRDHANYLFGEWVCLFHFIKSRSPKLIAEFAAWRKDDSQPPTEGKKEEN